MVSHAPDAAKTTRPPTPNEIRFLAGLVFQPPVDLLGWWSVPELIQFQPERFGDRSPQGLHETGASLVRKGLARKRKYGGKGPVEYRISDAGRAALGDPYQAGPCRGSGQPWLPAKAIAGRRFPAMCPQCNASPVMLRVPDPGPGEDPLVQEHPDMVVWSGRVDVVAWRRIRAVNRDI